MAYSKIKKLILVDDGGAMVPAVGATCYVYHATTLTLAQMYTDRNGSVLASNPVTIGADGYLDRYIESGPYDLRVVSGLDETTYPDFLAVDDIIVSGPSGDLQFSDVANLKAATPLNQKSYKVNWAGQLGRKVSTVVHNTTSNEGGADYVIVNVNPGNLSTLVGGIWVGANHDLGGGFYAKLILKESEYLDVAKCGAAVGGDIAPILLQTITHKYKVAGEFTCGEVSRDSLDIKIINGVINAPNSSTDDLFLNIRDFRLSSYGHSEIGTTEPYQMHVAYTESGNPLDNFMVGGDLLVDGGGITDTIFGAAAGVSPSSSLTVYISDRVEVTGFTNSGIDFRCSAMSDETDVYVGGIKSSGGAGRCIQFGDNDNGISNVTVEDCPKIGFVSSSGSSEAKGVLIYGKNVLVNNNKIFNVKNEAVSGGEGIYLKAAFSSITNNRLRNAGSSSDGCITLKGASYWDDIYADEGGYNVVTGNTVEMTSSDYDSKGICIFDSNTIASANILRDLRAGRSGLSYSEAFSIGGSAPVSNVTLDSNIVTGWYNFCGNYADTSKGRCRIGDNIKITNNTAVELDGGYVFTWDSRCLTAARPMTFDSATKTITIDGGTSQNGEFDRFVYPPGCTVVISGTSSNDGTYTVLEVSRYIMTVAESIVDENATPQIIRESVNSLKILGNSFSGFGTGLRSFSGKVDQVTIDGNDWMNGNYAYDLDAAGTIGELYIGAGETWTNLLNKQNGSPVADVVYRGVKIKSATGGTMTATSYEVDYNIAYT